MKDIRIPVLIVILLLALNTNLCADTVYLNDNIPIKGIVVEEYVDRIIYSTADGEKEILKSDIARIEYDEPVDNLINLGDSAFNKGYHRVALKYYLMAQAQNPDIKPLNNKIYHTETLIYKTPEIQKRDFLALKNEVISGYMPPVEPTEKASAKDDIKKEMGLSLSREKRGRFYIEGMKMNSPFRKAGAKTGDAIIAVWSKLCDYLTFGDIHNLFSDPREAMITITIERGLPLKNGDFSGAEFKMEWEGLTIASVGKDSPAQKAGLKKDDFVTAIGQESTRYMPLKEVLNRLKKNQVGINITIRRRLTVFKTK